MSSGRNSGSQAAFEGFKKKFSKALKERALWQISDQTEI